MPAGRSLCDWKGHKISHPRALLGEPVGRGALCGMGGAGESVAMKSPGEGRKEWTPV